MVLVGRLVCVCRSGTRRRRRLLQWAVPNVSDYAVVVAVAIAITSCGAALAVPSQCRSHALRPSTPAHNIHGIHGPYLYCFTSLLNL
jgi:hypothetical protein